MDKTIAFLLAGILVGAGAGIGIGYFVFNDSGDSETTYWFYIDFNGEATEFDDGWISAAGKDVVDGLIKAVRNAGLPSDISDTE